MATTDTDEPPISEPMRRVAEALIEGVTPPPDAQAALTVEERAEIAALVRTARLTNLTLHQPEAAPEVEAQAWSKAQEALKERPAIPVPEDAPRSRLREWLERVLKQR